MIVRPLDENGDWTPIQSLDQMKSGKDAVGQIINLRLNFYYGEWWENREVGFRVPEFLFRSIRSGELSLLANYIAAYVIESEGVRGVTNVNISKDRHKVTFRCVAVTDEGKKNTVEVDLDGLV